VSILRTLLLLWAASLLAACGTLITKAPAPTPGRDLELSESTPLIRAAARGDAAEVKHLLAAGTPVDSVSPLGVTPLMAAARKNQARVVEQLLIAGARPIRTHPDWQSSYT
jgi:ankyrin repeat protein